MRLALALAACLVLAACSGLPTEQAATPAPTTSPVEAGRALFRNKGCVTCHQHDGVPGESGLLAIAPDLTRYRGDPDYLRAWIDDPRALRPATAMPNIELSPAEIEALIAFINA